ncbi:hypothetical protein GF386_03305 [Candidatus Pacearchaeota archaeon]|nr:hypothetical protein [Candidatus Pacearchaeota archaeon]MBD3283167.1 hypothetical protein [Candidatus Pacearchaeota archaeon]
MIIEQISEKTGISIKELLKWFLQKIIEFWCSGINKKGLLLEMHAQNTLLEVDSDFIPRRVVVRDFCSVRVDQFIRDRLNLPDIFKKKIIDRNCYFSREQEYSLIYDYFICHHFLYPMIKICCKKYDLDFSYFNNYAQKVFNDNFTFDIFTNRCYGFADEVFVNRPPKIQVFSKTPFFRK